MNKEQGITVYKSNNIIEKVKKLFKRFFSRFYHKKYVVNEEKNVSENSNFKEEITIKQDEDRLRILKIQEDYQNGLIEEDEISKEDYKKLLELYDEQNNKIKEEIEKDRIEIKRMLELLKNKNSI